MRVSKDEFAELVEAALEELPEEFREFLEEVPVEVRDHPAPRQLKRARVPSDGLLLGLYEGRPRTRRSVQDSGVMPDVIYIFQEHIEAVSRTREDLLRQVRVT